MRYTKVPTISRPNYYRQCHHFESCLHNDCSKHNNAISWQNVCIDMSIRLTCKDSPKVSRGDEGDDEDQREYIIDKELHSIAQKDQRRTQKKKFPSIRWWISVFFWRMMRSLCIHLSVSGVQPSNDITLSRCWYRVVNTGRYILPRHARSSSFGHCGTLEKHHQFQHLFSYIVNQKLGGGSLILSPSIPSKRTTAHRSQGLS